MKDSGAVYDEVLVLRAQSGDSSAMAELVERWQPRLWTLARVLTSEDEAWDVTQEAWMAAVSDLRRLQSAAGFGPWMYRIVRNKAADRIRRHQRERALETSPEPIEDCPGADALDVRALLAAMPEQDRAVLTMHYLEELRYEEIASILDIPVGTVKSRLHYARERFKTIVERDHGRT